MKHRACRPSVPLLLLLLLAASAERRLADLDFSARAGSVIENDEAVRGDEVSVKLIALHDFVAPCLLPRAGSVAPASVRPVPTTVVRALVDPESPRAPPASHPSV